MNERNIFNFMQSTHSIFKSWSSIWKKELCFHYEINQKPGSLHISFFFFREEINIIALALITGGASLRITQELYLKINYFFAVERIYLSVRSDQ